MGWVAERIEKTVRRLAATATDLPLQRAVNLHAAELRELIEIGVSLGRIGEAMKQAGVVGRRSGKTLSGKAVHALLAKAPVAPPLQPPVEFSVRPPSAANVGTELARPPGAQLQPGIITSSRRGRGLESLAGRKPET